MKSKRLSKVKLGQMSSLISRTLNSLRAAAHRFVDQEIIVLRNVSAVSAVSVVFASSLISSSVSFLPHVLCLMSLSGSAPLSGTPSASSCLFCSCRFCHSVCLPVLASPSKDAHFFSHVSFSFGSVYALRPDGLSLRDFADKDKRIMASPSQPSQPAGARH
jgi:hypothetical protein